MPTPPTLLIVVMLCLAVTVRLRHYWLVAFCFGFLWAYLQALNALNDRVQAPVSEARITGVVSSLPVSVANGVLFELDVESIKSADSEGSGSTSQRVLVRWYDDPAEVIPGQHWEFVGRITTTQSRLNFTGTDAERRHWVRGIDGLFTVSGTPELLALSASFVPIQQWRYRIRAGLLDRLQGYERAGLVVALAIGDRSKLRPDIRRAMTATGTGHLLAISGLHVGLVGWLIFRTFKIFAGLSGQGVRWPSRQLAIAAGSLGALAYALIAGFGPSPQRAFIMFAVIALLMLLRRQVSPWQGWLIALGLVLLASPQTAASPGLWLSFGAVAALFFAFVGRRPACSGVHALLRAQFAVGLILLPLTWMIFHTGSPSSFLANLAAIPFVSLIALPLVLLSLLTVSGSGVIPEVLAAMADGSLIWLCDGLIWLATVTQTLTVNPPGFSIWVAGPAVIGAVLILSPRVFRLKACGALLMLPMLAPATAAPQPGEWTFDVLDVGQGSAGLLRTHRSLTLIDTGPGMPGAWDLSESVIKPAIASYPRQRLKTVVVTHGDLDHAGGLERIYQSWPHAAYLGNTRKQDPRLVACTHERYWLQDGVSVAVLHPSPFLPYRGNNSSCVLEVSGTRNRALLTGDIEKPVEQRLARQQNGAYSLLLAPHHGSKSSNSNEFTLWSAPELVAVSAGFNNRFGFPHARTVQRYQAAGAFPASTSDCGGLRYLHSTHGQLVALSARRQRPALWRWPPSANCP